MRKKRFCPYCAGRLEAKFCEGAVRRYCRRCSEPIYENPVPAVCALVTDERWRVLLVRRAVEPKRGFWCLPGGFMELGETPEAAVLRELREETGIDGDVMALMGLRSTPNRIYHTVLVVGFAVRHLAGRPVAGDDAQDIGWFEASGLPDIAFDSHRQFIKAFFQERDRWVDHPGKEARY